MGPDRLFQEFQWAGLPLEPEGRMEAIRARLRKLEPIHVLRLFFAADLAAQRPPIVGEIHSLHQGRRALLKWVYKDRPQVIRNLAFLRLPSRSKRALVKALLGSVRDHRDPWMNSKILHAMAFRPEVFDQPLGGKSWEQWWGPLYQRRRIPKGTKGYRTLWIPNRPLKRVQRTLLRLVFRHVTENIQDCVFGCGSEREDNLYHHVSRHLGQQFAVSFDLANFFDCVRIADVIRGLADLGTTEGESPEDTTHNRWQSTHDARLLVAKLVTHRGRLPQGAPTSPLVANLAFSRIDREILERVQGEIVYTRYFDDMTFSVSKGRAKSAGWSTPQQLAKAMSETLDEVLRNTHFSVNRRKTRFDATATGHRVTGLRVLTDRITLPREKKRSLRALIHSLEKYGLRSTAERKLGGTPLGETENKTKRKMHVRRGRSLSTEKLAVQMLRHLLPDLGIQDLRPPPEEGAAEIQNTDRWRYLEKLLYYIWRGQVQVIPEEGNGGVSVRDRDKKPVCTISADASLSLGFFCLPMRQAVLCVELWHQVRGLVASLRVPQNLSGFDEVRRLRTELGEALSQSVDLRLNQVLEVSHERPPDESLLSRGRSMVLTEAEVTREHAQRVFERVSEYHGYVTSRSPSGWSRAADEFQRPAGNRKQLATWMEAAVELCLRLVPRPPLPGPNRRKTDAYKILKALRVSLECEQGRRVRPYAEEDALLSRARLRGGFPHGAKEISRFQCFVLHDLESIYQTALEDYCSLSRDDWLRNQGDHVPDPEKQLNLVVDTFLERYERLCQQEGGAALFLPQGQEELGRIIPELRKEICAESTLQDCWEHLYSVAMGLCQATLEQLPECPEDSEETSSPKYSEAEMLKQQMQRIVELRNRGAHADTPSRRSEKRNTHLWWVKKLGRETRCEQDGNVRIMPLEALEIKVLMMEMMVKILSDAATRP